MPILRQGSTEGAVSTASGSNGAKEGHWSAEKSYKIPGGSVDSVQESSAHSGPGWHTQATKKTTTMRQEFSGSEVKPSSGQCTSWVVMLLSGTEAMSTGCQY